MRPPLPWDEAVESVRQRIDKYTERADNGCLEWTGSIGGPGYGQLSLAEVLHAEFGSRVATAPVLSCWLAHGPKPDDADCVLHSCDNKLCVEPDHLRWGTIAENNAAAWERGQQAQGERHGHAFLTDEQVAEIVSRAEAGERVRALADEFGIDWSTVYRWMRGELRADVA